MTGPVISAYYGAASAGPTGAKIVGTPSQSGQSGFVFGTGAGAQSPGQGGNGLYGVGAISGTTAGTYGYGAGASGIAIGLSTAAAAGKTGGDHLRVRLRRR